jgi:hypothetical protein
VLLDSLDILTEALSRFGSFLPSTEYADKIQKSLLKLVFEHHRPAIRKRATVAIGHLVSHLTDVLFDELIQALMTAMDDSSSYSQETVKAVTYCLATICRQNAPRLGKYLDQIVVTTIKHAERDDDELKECCLQVTNGCIECSPIGSEIS